MSGEPEWRWADPNGQQRLVRGDELRAALANGLIPPNAPVWRKGWLDWQPASDVPELVSSALSAQNGVVPNIPPPPLFVLAAQSAFEGSPRPPSVMGDEPPPPPRYLPAPLRPPAPPSSSSSLSRPPPSVKAKATPATANRPPPNSTRPPISQRMSATEALKRAVPSSSKVKSVPPTKSVTERAAPVAQTPRAPDTQPDVNVGRLAANPTPRGGITVPTAVGVPRIADPRISNAPRQMDVGDRGSNHTPPMPMAVDRRAETGRSTLLFDGSAPSSPPPARAGSPAPPIVVPGSDGAEKNAVTRPPPVDMGIMQMSPGSHRKKEDSSEELSGSMIIEHTDNGPRISKPPKPPPMQSKRPAPGLRALASGSPGALSRPPAPPLDGYAPGGNPSISTSTVHGVPSLDPPRQTSPSKPLSLPPAASASASRPLSPPTLMGIGAIPSPGPPPADLMAQVKAAERGSRPSVPDPDPSPPDARLAWMEPVLQRFPQLRRLQVGKPVFFLPVIGGIAALVALVLLGLLVRGCVSLLSGDDKASRRRGREKASMQTETETTSPGSSTVVAPATTETAMAPAPTETGPACRGTGVAKTLAPKALVTSGVETMAFARTIGVGFATTAKEGTALELDPATLNVVATARARGADLKRVTPVQVGGRLAAAADVDKRADALVGGRTIAAANPFEVGFRDGHVAIAPRGGSAINLWPLEGDAPVEAIRGAASAAGHALAFRRGASVFTGAITSQMKISGPLVETRGLGTQVGSPSVGVSGATTLVMWADRSNAEQPWGLRMRRITAQGGEDPQAFAPVGGPGAPFIAPSLVGLAGGRFLVVWTEGAAKSHQVRGATLDSSGKIEGAPFTLSPPTSNAGQAQVVLGVDGRGVVVYLVSSATEGFELAAAGITCAP